VKLERGFELPNGQFRLQCWTGAKWDFDFEIDYKQRRAFLSAPELLGNNAGTVVFDAVVKEAKGMKKPNVSANKARGSAAAAA
jgi:hypothetical protein